jgi:hypothetical protein
MTGPAAVLLTNVNGYSARVTIELAGMSNNATPMTGQLLVRSSHMLFSPKTGDSTFIWDVKEESGYILSEALQGYAPLASGVHVTRMQTMSETAGASSDQVNGHPGHESEEAITCDDGSVTKFGVWRASDLGGFPVRIRTINSPMGYTLNFSNMRSEDLSLKLFQPPEGFTKYSSTDSMVGELFARKGKAKNAGNTTPVDPKSSNNYSY